jgi:hypothetical protein
MHIPAAPTWRNCAKWNERSVSRTCQNLKFWRVFFFLLKTTLQATTPAGYT